MKSKGLMPWGFVGYRRGQCLLPLCWGLDKEPCLLAVRCAHLYRACSHTHPDVPCGGAQGAGMRWAKGGRDSAVIPPLPQRPRSAPTLGLEPVAILGYHVISPA